MGSENRHLQASRAIKRSLEGATKAIALSGADIVVGEDGAPAQSTHGIYVGTTGDVKVQLCGDTSPQVFASLAGGMTHPLNCSRVFNTGTTATGVKALW